MTKEDAVKNVEVGLRQLLQGLANNDLTNYQIYLIVTGMLHQLSNPEDYLDDGTIIFR